MTHSPPPQPLHLLRLAEAQAGQWVALPSSTLRVVQLAGKMPPQSRYGWLLCLQGEAVIDLPELQFVRLRVGEGYAVPPQWKAVALAAPTVLLLSEGSTKTP